MGQQRSVREVFLLLARRRESTLQALSTISKLHKGHLADVEMIPRRPGYQLYHSPIVFSLETLMESECKKKKKVAIHIPGYSGGSCQYIHFIMGSKEGKEKKKERKYPHGCSIFSNQLQSL